jgi:anthranilate phosphoribosyltransferase
MADESASALGAPVASPTWRSPAATSLDSQGAIPLLLKRIGRGAQGSRSLERDEAAALFGWILDGIIHPAQLGAVLIALRMKGETVAEVAGVLDAVQRRLRPVGVESARPVVAIPS